MLRLNIITLILKLLEDATNVVVAPFAHEQAKNGIGDIICDFWVLFLLVQKR
jgi:hypothetical protein